MPWKQMDPVSERLKFVAAALSGRESMTEVCARFGISRRTGYERLKRFRSEGASGLEDRSRAPLRHPNQTAPELEKAILRVRRTHPTWGSKKILAVLGREWALSDLPARSTVDQVLRRAGVVSRRRSRRRSRPARSAPIVNASAPNDVWSIDYKGWFRVGDGTRCDPLTINDVYSRASLECRAMVSPKLEDARSRLDRLFRDVGMPLAVLSDNGAPFGSQGIAGLSRLSIWLLKLRIRPIFIQPGHPEQNGRHERFHETLKAETASPPRASLRAQQFAFDRFTACYNEERPHEALDMRTPSDVYRPSPRQMPSRLPEFEYSDSFEVRRVRTDGVIKWTGKSVFIGRALCGELVGIEPVDESKWHVHAGSVRLGVLHEASKLILPLAEDQGH